MLVEVKVERLTLDRATQSPVVVLREENGERALPIWIGAGEASAIHMQMAHLSVGRPLTHDLLVSTIRGLGAVLQRVVITRVEHNTYFAQLELQLENRAVNLDARPSDSIAVALRTGSPIFAAEELLDMVRVEIADGDEPSTPGGGSAGPHEARPPARQAGMSAAELQEYLRKLNPEDFGRFNP
ncbi:MAG TPA: bifunctional nuclease family protein [Longimicrobiales bacterium]|nr:bifunctional nuclease family protein [Longimicrobiales bacterium]